jgi:hypothetical protein
MRKESKIYMIFVAINIIISMSFLVFGGFNATPAVGNLLIAVVMLAVVVWQEANQ